MASDFNPDLIQTSGELFEAVQRSRVFPDSKQFVDMVPTEDPEIILSRWREQKGSPDFDLERFIADHFELPVVPGETIEIEQKDHCRDHIRDLWPMLFRSADSDNNPQSSLIPLPHPYIVPGGRFREIYYWDTYFTAEGLAAADRMDTVKNLTRNFAYLVEKVGHVPNGNRYYYISRSQPPFLVMLVDLIARREGDEAIEEFIPALKQEYDFWMEGSDTLSEGETHRRVANIDGCIMNRYWDDRPLPREESWREDFELATGLDARETEERYRHLRAG